MATKKAETPAPAPIKRKQRVKIRIPRIPGEKVQDDVVISINGRAIQIQRGVEVEIPIAYARELKRVYRARDEADEFRFSVIND